MLKILHGYSSMAFKIQTVCHFVDLYNEVETVWGYSFILLLIQTLFWEQSTHECFIYFQVCDIGWCIKHFSFISLEY